MEENRIGRKAMRVAHAYYVFFALHKTEWLNYIPNIGRNEFDLKPAEKNLGIRVRLLLLPLAPRL